MIGFSFNVLVYRRDEQMCESGDNSNKQSRIYQFPLARPTNQHQTKLMWKLDLFCYEDGQNPYKPQETYADNLYTVLSILK